MVLVVSNLKTTTASTRPKLNNNQSAKENKDDFKTRNMMSIYKSYYSLF